MFKQVVATSLVALAIGSSSAWAANDATTAINITASIPTQTFYVLPVNSDFGRAEVMNYNLQTGLLSTLRQSYSIKNTSGSIKAYIDGGPVALSNGTTASNIALVTTFNGKTLTAVSQEVLASGATAIAGISADLVITPATPGDGVSGNFTAAYTVVFDNVPTI
ncbi:CS1 type fimbrial major subunit [Pseudomonas kulmbachensis]|uniref:CS1 type fimbrial major subunit n=1 Tax=Pseudomonas kulmbachensis TaxID=3043408 RepID=UPI002AB29712|nr:CS1 type fimbrial major subunit [Pseudomonas sp. V3/3/4/13]